MIELNVTNLVGGNITITTGGSEGSYVEREATRVWYYGDNDSTYTDYDISGEISGSWSDEDEDYTFTDAIPMLSNARKIEIGTKLTSIGHHAFIYCTWINSITIPSSVTNIGRRAFFGCSGLTNVTIPDSVTSIGPYAFSGCSGLTSLIFQGRTLQQLPEIIDDEGD